LAIDKVTGQYARKKIPSSDKMLLTRRAGCPYLSAATDKFNQRRYYVSDNQTLEILRKSQKAFKRFDDLAAAKRKNDEEIRTLCREYGILMKVWGWQPHMLRQAVEARLGKKTA